MAAWRAPLLLLAVVFPAVAADEGSALAGNLRGLQDAGAIEAPSSTPVPVEVPTTAPSTSRPASEFITTNTLMPMLPTAPALPATPTMPPTPTLPPTLVVPAPMTPPGVATNTSVVETAPSTEAPSTEAPTTESPSTETMPVDEVPAPTGVGRFIKEMPGGFIYFQDATQQKKHLVRVPDDCSECGTPNPCLDNIVLPTQYIDKLVTGIDFFCDMLGGGSVDNSGLPTMASTTTPGAAASQVPSANTAAAPATPQDSAAAAGAAAAEAAVGTTTVAAAEEAKSSGGGSHGTLWIMGALLIGLLGCGMVALFYHFRETGECDGKPSRKGKSKAKAQGKKSIWTSSEEKTPLMPAGKAEALPTGAAPPTATTMAGLPAVAPATQMAMQQQPMGAMSSFQQQMQTQQLPTQQMYASPPQAAIVSYPPPLQSAIDFNRFDANHDGTISRAEFVQAAVASASAPQAAMPTMQLGSVSPQYSSAMYAAQPAAPNLQDYDLVTVTEQGISVQALPHGSAPPQGIPIVQGGF